MALDPPVELQLQQDGLHHPNAEAGAACQLVGADGARSQQGNDAGAVVGREAPYYWYDLPVILGTLGGIGELAKEALGGAPSAPAAPPAPPRRASVGVPPTVPGIAPPGTSQG